jgi:hypothetical protein
LLTKSKAIFEGSDRDLARTSPAILADALAIFEAHDPTPELVDALTEHGINVFWASRATEAVPIFNRAMDVAKSLGLPIPGRALGFRGEARMETGDPGGMDDLRESRAIARDAGRGRDLVIATVNSGAWQHVYEGPSVALRSAQEAMNLATRFGFVALASGIRCMSTQFAVDAGELDLALEIFKVEDLAAAPLFVALGATYASEPRIQVLHGQEADALAGAATMVEIALSSDSPDRRIVLLAYAAGIRQTCGKLTEAVQCVEHVLATERRASTQSYAGHALPHLIRAACAGQRVDLAQQILDEAPVPFPFSEHAQVGARALLAEHRGRLHDALEGFRDAAQRWAGFGMPFEEAHAHIGHARCLLALERHAEAAAPTASARSICERLGAKPMLADLANLEEAISAHESESPDTGTASSVAD